MPQQIASLFATIGADTSGLASGLTSARGQLTRFQGEMSRIGSSMMGIGAMMTGALTVPLVGAGVAAIKTAGEFEAATNILAIAARQSGTPLEDLREAAVAVGRDTQLIGIDAMEAADAMTTFYKTGFTTAEVMGDLDSYLEEGTNLTGMLRAAIDLTAASDLDLARASDAVAIAIKTFQLNAEDATAIADSFVGAADASVAEVSDLTDAMYTFGPTANQYGWSLQDTNTALAILSERGIRGAEAGTALRSMMTNMMRDTKEAKGALDTLGISLYDQNGQMRALPDIVGQLASAMSGLSDEERNAYIQALAGTYGMKAMATLVAEGSEGWNDMASAIESAASAQEIGEERTKGLEGAVEQMKGAWQTFMIEAGTPFLDQFATPAVQKITDIVNALSDLSPSQMKGVVDALLPLVVTGPILLGAGALLKTLSAIPLPILAAASAAVVLGGALWFGSDKGKEFAENLKSLDEVVYKVGGTEALQDWITARQRVAGAQQTVADIEAGGTPESRAAAQSVFGYPEPGETGIERFNEWGLRFFGSGDDPGIVGRKIYEMWGWPEGMIDPLTGGVGGATPEDYAPFQERIYAPPEAPEVAKSVFGYPAYGETGNMWGWPNEWQGINQYGGVGNAPYGPEMPTPGLTGLFGEDLTGTIQLSIAQTPEEMTEMIEGVLPAEGSLTRSVTILARPDPGQLARSADQVAAAWEQAIALRLERIKKNKLIETGGLLEGAAAVGMTR